MSQRRIPSRKQPGPGPGRPDSRESTLTITARLLARQLSGCRGTNQNILVRHDSVCRVPGMCETFEIWGPVVLGRSEVVPKVVPDTPREACFLTFAKVTILLFCAKRKKVTILLFPPDSVLLRIPTQGKGSLNICVRRRQKVQKVTESRK